MNWDDDGWNPYYPYGKRRPYGKKGWWSNDQWDKYNTWKKWTKPKSSKDLDETIKKAWEKLEHWVPKRDPALTESLTLTPNWSDIEKLYKHITRLYKHIAVLHDEVSRLKKRVVLEPMLKRHRLTAKEKKKNVEKRIDKEIKHLKSMGYHPSPTAFGRKPKKKRSKKK